MIRGKKLPAVIIRPDQIFGPGDHLHFGAMADRLRAGRGIVVGSGDNSMPFVYVDDVVHGLLLALDHDAAPGHAYNITNDRAADPAGNAHLDRAPRSAPARQPAGSRTARCTRRPGSPSGSPR